MDTITSAELQATLVKKIPGVKTEIVKSDPPPLLVVVRFPIGIKDEDRMEVELEVCEVRKATGLAIVCAPIGVTFTPTFQPAEMQSWKREIQFLRKEVDDQKRRADEAEAKLEGYHQTAISNSENLKEQLSKKRQPVTA